MRYVLKRYCYAFLVVVQSMDVRILHFLLSDVFPYTFFRSRINGFVIHDDLPYIYTFEHDEYVHRNTRAWLTSSSMRMCCHHD